MVTPNSEVLTWPGAAEFSVWFSAGVFRDSLFCTWLWGAAPSPQLPPTPAPSPSRNRKRPLCSGPVPENYRCSRNRRARKLAFCCAAHWSRHTNFLKLHVKSQRSPTTSHQSSTQINTTLQLSVYLRLSVFLVLQRRLQSSIYSSYFLMYVPISMHSI